MHEIAICTDCLFVLANGVENDETQRAAHDMSQKWDHVEITLGKSHENCTHSSEYDTECESLGFSNQPCEGCGSSLGGDRYAATVWIEEEED